MESEQHFLYWVELNTCEQNWHPLQPNGSHKPEKQAAWGSNLFPGPVKPVALVQGVPYKWDLPNGKSPDRQGQGASSAHQGTYPDAGRGVTTSQILLFSFPKWFLRVGVLGQCGHREREVLKAKVALATAAGGGVFLSPSTPALEFQLLRWQAWYDQGTALQRGYLAIRPLGASSNSPLSQRRLVWRETP